MNLRPNRASATRVAGLIFVAIVNGCSQPEAVKLEERVETPTKVPVTTPVAPTTAPAKPVGVAETPPSNDPQASAVGYLKHVADKTKSLKQYRVTFIRQERLGVVPVLKKQERIAAAFRAEPFSVHFAWLAPDSE